MILAQLTLTFADRAAALAAFRALLSEPALDGLPPDASVDGRRLDIAELGAVTEPATGAAVPGWHLLVAWRGAPETVPAVLAAAAVDRSGLDWWPRLG